jgi:hypothetical protein
LGGGPVEELAHFAHCERSPEPRIQEDQVGAGENALAHIFGDLETAKLQIREHRLSLALGLPLELALLLS